MTGEQREPFERGMDAPSLLRAQLQETHRELDDGLTAYLRGLAPAAPPGGALPLRLYVHAATVEDITVQSLLRHVPPLYATDWAGNGPARYSPTDLAPLRAYAQQVFAATDAYLAGLGPDALSQQVDLSRLGLGKLTIAWVVSKFIVLQLAQICGELTSAGQHR